VATFRKINDQVFVEKVEFERLAALAAEVGRLIAGLMDYPRKSGIRGSKFKPSN
jgi:hypothetical protein